MPGERSFDPVRPGQHGHFGRCDGAPLVVMGVNAQGRFVPAGVAPAERLDHVGEFIRRTAFDGGGEVQHEIAFAARLPCLPDRFGQFDDGADLAVGKFLRRKLVPDAVAHSGRVDGFRDHAGAVNGRLHDFSGSFTEDEFPVELACRNIAMNCSPADAGERGDRPVDQVLPGGSEHIDADAVGMSPSPIRRRTNSNSSPDEAG